MPPLHCVMAGMGGFFASKVKNKHGEKDFCLYLALLSCRIEHGLQSWKREKGNERPKNGFLSVSPCSAYSKEKSFENGSGGTPVHSYTENTVYKEVM